MGWQQGQQLGGPRGDRRGMQHSEALDSDGKSPGRGEAEREGEDKNTGNGEEEEGK